jgi:hypothetical protein
MTRSNFQQALNWYSLLMIIRFVQRELHVLETEFISILDTGTCLCTSDRKSRPPSLDKICQLHVSLWSIKLCHIF